MKKTEEQLKAELHELRSKRTKINNKIGATKKKLGIQSNKLLLT